MSQVRIASLFRNGRNQSVRIPVEFEFPGTEVEIRQNGDELIMRPRPRKTLMEVLEEMEPLAEDDAFPDIDSDHLPDREIEI